MATPHWSSHRLRDESSIELFVRVFSATSAEARGTEFERLQIVPLVFGLLPVASLMRRRPDERVKPAIRDHLLHVGVADNVRLVEVLKDISDQYFEAVLRPIADRARKFGVESVRALRRGTYEHLRRRQDHRCAICGTRLGADSDETLDHILPWALVGDRFDGSNWQLLCRECNHGKREWLSALQSPQALGWHYGASDALPLEMPTSEARYVALATLGKCQAQSCGARPMDTRLVVRRRLMSGFAVFDNLWVLCEEHLESGGAPGSAPPPPGHGTSQRAVHASASSGAVRSGPADPPPVFPSFAGYSLVKRVAGGGMAECYLAVDEETGEEVFLKRCMEGSTDARALQREAEIYQKLQRQYAEHVPNVIDADRVDGFQYLVTERAQEDLEQYVLDREGLSTDAARSMMRVIIEGLREIHGAGIIHRDLKPSNVLRIGDRWVLADFGISKDLRGSMGQGTFQLRGTSGYAAPEQLMTGVEARESADVFALGKIAVFLVTGHTDIDHLHFRQWRDLVRRCTDDDPDARPTLDAVTAIIDDIRE